MRGRSYTPSQPRVYGRRGRIFDPRGGPYCREDDVPTSLLVRNLHLDCSPEDLRTLFGQFGTLKDIYLHYYTGDEQGFGIVQYVDPADAKDAKDKVDGQIFHERELTVGFARKRPTEMRARGRRRYSHSPSPSLHSSSRSRDYYYAPPSPRRIDRSYTHNALRNHRTPVKEHSPNGWSIRSASPGPKQKQEPVSPTTDKGT